MKMQELSSSGQKKIEKGPPFTKDLLRILFFFNQTIGRRI